MKEIPKEGELIRMSTGIQGLDEMLEGGAPFPSTLLVAGGAGTGKTTFGLQFLFEGAKRGEQGVYFTTLSETPQWLLRFTSRFKFIDRKYLGKEIRYVDLGKVLTWEKTSQSIIGAIEKEMSAIMPQRVVIDPITVVKDRLGNEYRPFVFELCARLKNWQSLTILTGEVMPEELYPLELAYTVDGIILLTNIEEEGRRVRYLEILKMRGTEHLTGKYQFSISKNGITVIPGLK
ncbi:MAG: ATPase domain-containing protein [Candidatus Thermoplasmatota archaeon]|nr:ATPase domain-containing protein [Candidatus Thermoplasmatota archaeon]